jgi:hypothetical protein
MNLIGKHGDSIAVSEFVKRQTKESEFSYFDGTWEQLKALAEKHFYDNKSAATRPDVLLVNVPPLLFYSGIVTLKEGDLLTGVYKARQPGEVPRKSVQAVKGEKLPASSVQLILYSHDALAEKNEHSSDADWEIISINASPVEGVEVPIPIGALIANYFDFDGGTKTTMTPEQFIAQLKESAIFWQNKAMLMPQPDLDITKYAHQHCSHNKEELLRSTKLGCFYCLADGFQFQDIQKWVDDSDTAICPCCGIDSVIGSASGFPITTEFLSKMCGRWFGVDQC